MLRPGTAVVDKTSLDVLAGRAKGLTNRATASLSELMIINVIKLVETIIVKEELIIEEVNLLGLIDDTCRLASR